MLGTGTALSDWLCFSQITPMRPGDEAHALNLVVPCNAPGLKIYPRRSYAAAAPDVFDYPLAARFDESDSMIVFDDVFVPWEQIFVYRDLELVRAQWWDTSAHVVGNHQSQIRFASKLRLIAGIARRIAAMNGVDGLAAVQELLGDLAARAAMIEGLVEAQIATATPVANGYVEPGRQALYAAIALQSEAYSKMLELLRELAGGGVVALPSGVADFANAEIRADIDRYIQSPGHDGASRFKLMRLAWELVGSEYAGRQEQYEKFYAGPPFVARHRMYQRYDFARAERLVDAALAGYDLDGGR